MKEHHAQVAVVGAGHAGIEAALAAARMGLDTVLFTLTANGFLRFIEIRFSLPVLLLSTYECTPSARERGFCARSRPPDNISWRSLV